MTVLPEIPMRRLVGDFVTAPLDSDLDVVSVFAVVKAIDDHGSIAWAARSGGAKLSSEELLGALEGLTESLRRDLAGDWDW